MVIEEYNTLSKMREYLEKRYKVWDEGKEKLLSLLQDPTKTDADLIIACRALIAASYVFQIKPDTSIEDLDFSQLLKRPLLNAGIKTFGELIIFYETINPEDPWMSPSVKDMKGFGRKCWRELKEFMTRNR
jgi:hypothetical protein